MYNLTPIEKPVDPRLITIGEAAERLSATKVTVRTYLTEGRLTKFPVSPHCTLVDEREVEILKEARR